MSKSLKEDLNDYARSVKDSALVDDSHFYDFRQNIYGGTMKEEIQDMFLKGDGNELVSKACAVHSSSMLGYNFFHWVAKEAPLRLYFGSESGKDVIEYTDVLYEVKIPVLKGSRAANMDIVLKNDSGDILFIESKFLEYTSTGKFTISDSYKKADSYYSKGKEWAEFILKFDTRMEKQYWDGIKQEICHSIGMWNWAAGKDIDNLPSFSDARDIRFIYLVFEPNPKYEKEYAAFKAYRERYEELHEKLKNDNLIPNEIKMSFLTYTDIWSDITDCITPDLKKYLDEHYMVFANPNSNH